MILRLLYTDGIVKNNRISNSSQNFLFALCSGEAHFITDGCTLNSRVTHLLTHSLTHSLTLW